MSNEDKDMLDGNDAVVRDRLREFYAAPSDPEYWSELQVRILSRIADSNPALWWVFLGRWSRAGIVAAVLALMAAGVASIALDRVEQRVAYQSLIDDRVPLTMLERISRTAGVSDQEAALRYVLPY